MSTNWNEIHCIQKTCHPHIFKVVTIADACYFIISEDGTTEDTQEHFDTFEEADIGYLYLS